MSGTARNISLYVVGDKIIDQDDNEITISEAKALWEGGRLYDCNLSFKRLATRANWDFTELARQYSEMDAHDRA